MPLLNALLLDEFEKLGRGEHHILSWEALSVLIRYETSAAKNNGQMFDCRLIKAGGLTPLIEQIKSETKSHDTSFRGQIIVQFEQHQIPHYVTLHVYIDKNISKCFVLDASNCAESFPGLLARLRPLFQHVYAAIGSEKSAIVKLQNDTHSCPLFAFDHAREVNQLSDCFKFLEDNATYICSFNALEKFAKEASIETKELRRLFDIHPPEKSTTDTKSTTTTTTPNQSVVFWDMLPASLLWNVQSRSSVAEYVKKYEKSSLAENARLLNEHVNAHKVTISHKEKTKEANGSLQIKTAGYHRALINFLTTISEVELAAFLFGTKARLVSESLRVVEEKWPRLPQSQFARLREYTYRSSESLLKQFIKNAEKLNSTGVDLVQEGVLSVGEVLADRQVNEKLLIPTVPTLIRQGILSSALLTLTHPARLRRLNTPDLQNKLTQETSLQKKIELVSTALSEKHTPQAPSYASFFTGSNTTTTAEDDNDMTQLFRASV